MHITITPQDMLNTLSSLDSLNVLVARMIEAYDFRNASISVGWDDSVSGKDVYFYIQPVNLSLPYACDSEVFYLGQVLIKVAEWMLHDIFSDSTKVDSADWAVFHLPEGCAEQVKAAFDHLLDEYNNHIEGDWNFIQLTSQVLRPTNEDDADEYVSVQVAGGLYPAAECTFRRSTPVGCV